MLKQISMVKSGLHHTAVVTEKVEEGMEGLVDNVHMQVIPEYALLHPCFKKLLRDAEIADIAWMSRFFINTLVVFLEVIKEERIHLGDLADGKFHDSE